MSFTKAVRKQAKLRLVLPSDKFGSLTAVSDAGRIGSEKRPASNCVCDCGAQVVVMNRHLLSGHTKSCGCIKAANALKHGHKRRAGPSGTYVSWQSMIQRCTQPASDSYALYGGRGISVCERWNSFETFLADMGERPEGGSIDRIDSSKNYEPSNCKWSSVSEQASNKRSNYAIPHMGTSGTIAGWAEKTGLAYSCIYKRLSILGWSIEKSLTTPSRKEI